MKPIDNSPSFVSIEDVKGETTGTVFNGKFKVKPYITNRERSDVARLMDDLANGIITDTSQRVLLSTIAHLSFHVVEAPDWWGDMGLDLVDQEPIYALSDKVKELQNPAKAEEKPLTKAAPAKKTG
jgi:hypothetical protein